RRELTHPLPSHKFATPMPFIQLTVSCKKRLYHLPSQVALHFDLRDSHPPLGPTPLAEFHRHWDSR
ncbi:hypothetical protein P9136_30240, partial [Bacillus cereus]|nr:hypothetical protein [Bacillus cereus]